MEFLKEGMIDGSYDDQQRIRQIRLNQYELSKRRAAENDAMRARRSAVWQALRIGQGHLPDLLGRLDVNAAADLLASREDLWR
jgi:hypothetical protein